MIGNLSGQDGGILPARDTSFVLYNKFFIDQACSVKMAGYWPHSFFFVFMDLDFVSVHKHSKKELGQYPAILTSCLVNNPYILNSQCELVKLWVLPAYARNELINADCMREMNYITA